jgi:COP9 signalosome complex subunit 2
MQRWLILASWPSFAKKVAYRRIIYLALLFLQLLLIPNEGGKMQMLESNWLGAYNEFYESFRSYQEAGNARARDLLKYVVLASMLSLSDINPFAAREARAFTDDKEIVAMSELRQCLEANDLARFESTIRNKQNKILDEPFLMTYIQPLRQRMREQVLLNLTIPFKRVTISYLAEELSIDDNEVERLLVLLIQDHRLNASIDQRDNHLLVHSYADDRPGCPPEEFYGSLSAWANSLLECEEAFCDKIS